MKNKIVLITGASSGIGAACAECFAKEGAHLILTARRQERLETLQQKLEQTYKVRVLPIQLDVTDYTAVEAVIGSLDASWCDIDILLNNAGVALSSDKIQDVAVEKLTQTIDTNIKGVVHTTKAILPIMLARNSGHIVNIGSISSHYVLANTNIYTATKHAIKGFSQLLRVDLLGTPIRVSQVDPGVTKTEVSDMRWGKARAEAFYTKMQALDAMDIAEAVVFCTTRRAGVNIDDMIVNNINIAGTYVVPASGNSGGNIFDE